MKVDGTFVDYNIRWNNVAGGWKAKWRPIDIGGKVGICGVGAFWGHSSRSLSKRVMRDTSIKVDGMVVAKDLRFFAEVRTRDQLTNATATCVSSNVPVSAIKAGNWSFEGARRQYRD